MKKVISTLLAVAFVLSSSMNSVAANSYDSKWGTFATVRLSGAGADVVQLAKPLRAGVIKVTHEGEANFIVHSLGANLATNDYLVNEIGAYSGASIFGLGFGSKKTYGFEIDADGAWTVTLIPFAKVANMRSSGSGSGVYKVKYSSRKVVKFTHDGEQNFIVHQYCTNGITQYVINEIGPYSGKKVLSAGSCIIEINADGNWTAK